MMDYYLTTVHRGTRFPGVLLPDQRYGLSVAIHYREQWEMWNTDVETEPQYRKLSYYKSPCCEVCHIHSLLFHFLPGFTL